VFTDFTGLDNLNNEAISRTDKNPKQSYNVMITLNVIRIRLFTQHLRTPVSQT